MQNGVLSSLPHVVSYVGAVMSGELADLLRRRKICSTTVTRKLFQSICTFVHTDVSFDPSYRRMVTKVYIIWPAKLRWPYIYFGMTTINILCRTFQSDVIIGRMSARHSPVCGLLKGAILRFFAPALYDVLHPRGEIWHRGVDHSRQISPKSVYGCRTTKA